MHDGSVHVDEIPAFLCEEAPRLIVELGINLIGHVCPGTQRRTALCGAHKSHMDARILELWAHDSMFDIVH